MTENEEREHTNNVAREVVRDLLADASFMDVVEIASDYADQHDIEIDDRFIELADEEVTRIVRNLLAEL